MITQLVLMLRLLRSNTPFGIQYLLQAFNKTLSLNLNGRKYVQNKDKLTLFHLHFSYPKLKKMVRMIPSEINGIIIDGGANNGLFSVLVAEKFYNTKIYAFEPYPKMLPILRNNFNGLNIELVEKALSDKTEKINLYTSKESDQIGSLIKDNVEVFRSDIQSHLVDAIRLDDFVEQQKIDRIAVLKLDVQGAEYKILYSALESLKRTDHLIIELMFIEETVFDLMELIRPIFPYYKVINKVSYGADIIFSKVKIE